MELGKETTSIVQIPVPLLPILGSQTAVLLPSPRFMARRQPAAPYLHPYHLPPSAITQHVAWPCLEIRKGRALPPVLPRYTHSMCTQASSAGGRPLQSGRQIWAGVQRTKKSFCLEGKGTE